MSFLSSEEMLNSPVVANSEMNRDRRLSGVNSYEREIGFNPLERLLKGNARWYDACCGNGSALADAKARLGSTAEDLDISVFGVDLVGAMSSEIDYVTVADVMTFTPADPVDLITCVHGAHYVGDKLGLLEHFHSLLAPGGLIACNVDLANILVDGVPLNTWKTLAKISGMAAISAQYRKHVLTMTRFGDTALSFGLKYVGATVSAVPNYTGITVIDSWYER